MTLRIVTDATAEPVSIADIKAHLRLSTASTTEDSYLGSLIKVARQYAENFTKRCFLPQTWELTAPTFDGDEIILNRSPLSTEATNVVITYMDAASGDSTTLSSTVYGVDYDTEPGRVYLLDGQEWPEHWTDRKAVKIQFVAGFPITTGASATDTCPEDIEHWIKMRVGSMYENRESLQPNPSGLSLDRMPRMFVDGLLDRHCVIEVGP